MPSILQLGDRTLTPSEIISMLAEYQMLPQLGREILIDKAIVSVQISSTEQAIAIEQYYQKHQLTNITKLQDFLCRYGLSENQLESLAIRELKIEKFKLITWENKL